MPDVYIRSHLDPICRTWYYQVIRHLGLMTCTMTSNRGAFTFTPSVHIGNNITKCLQPFSR